MDQISEAQLAEIERQIVGGMVAAFGVDTSGLVLDMTNFAAYIDSSNERAPIAQRGHAKQKRRDLRLIGLGLVVSVDGGIPLVSHAYEGDRPDVTQFPRLVEELAARFTALGVGPDTVGPTGSRWSSTRPELRGQPGTDRRLGVAFRRVAATVGHPELLAVPAERYRPVDPERFAGLTAFETTKVVFGQPRRVVV